ncbi:Lrp/AsnC family transcriptional regulator [Ktedonosporobacter rubrisoli]|uniref:Lrp/AsnC family transcriptional regulator n=1 Tax=Ktedonosporobacter rubrisoli TaxID=2509675 RepID=A0A4P6JKQ3_KTERU|nr:Lrp/AsnC family transcriptional regulator [Ktedonosporobacter rubrisoli]QBD75777.1 Lrp/AsnC family transcriptional regulator [Ktedonosporobacter rubrisoli]
MTSEITKLLDETGWHLLQELQENARLSYAELGQRVGLSSSSVIERVRKMEEAGIISGYHAAVNLNALGLPVLAIVRLRSFAGENCRQVISRVSEMPEVLEYSKVTGSDCVVVKVAAASIDHLERIIERLSLSGPASTSIVFSRPLQRRTITRELLERAGGKEDHL